MLESIAFIPDGNRRYAKQEKISIEESYKKGIKNFWNVLNWLKKYSSITTITFYAFSLKNFDRSKTEVNILMKLFEEQLIQVIDSELTSNNDTRIKFIGRTELFPKKLRDEMKRVEEKTALYSKRTINLALGYDGQTEILDAIKKISLEVEKGFDLDSLTPQIFSKYLYGDFKAPDAIIRTSNEQRLSGFLTFQSSYSELFFLNKFWPEVTEEDIDGIVREFSERERRFGK